MPDVMQHVGGWVLWSVLSVYMLAMLLIGLYCSKKIKDMDDFIVAGRRLGFWVATATMVATQFGAGSCMGVAAQVYDTNVRDVIADPIAMSVCLLLASWFIVGKLRQGRYTTVPDILQDRYGKPAGVFSSIFMLPVYIGWTGAQMIGFGTLVHILLPQVSLMSGILIGGGIVLAYTLFGGMWAVTMTDVVQVCIMIVGLFLIVPGMFHEAGGFREIVLNQKEMISILPEAGGGFGNHVYYLGTWIIMGLGCMVGQELIQRSSAAKDEATAKSSCFISGFIYFFIGCLSISIGLAAKILFPKWGFDPSQFSNLENEVLPRMAIHILGNMNVFLLAVFVCALMAAIMSSSDSSLLATSTLFVRNVLLPICPNISLRRQLLVTRCVTLIALIFSVWLALSVDSIYGLMVNSWSSLLVIVVMPCIGAMYVKCSGKIACWSCMLTGAVVWLGYVTYHARQIPESFPALLNSEAFDYHLTNGSVYGFVAGILAFFIGCCFDRCRK